ncbi:MAG: helix-turn-helix domain-containing protein [Candidatus Marinimicrobia bacterium]|jgi:cytoskeletal protein RodZ|nr:helix-turn-helix domain-containing protein [Candidatus Neomarinimicrobiota bacterium]MDP6852573.1 helix-turn-helix domain-containing protein [Candidatus Neomarinimicrobiota bacterium]MDP6936022.1 helix-turn-helix domain-containing protein [Candidatus Neomarinimicrobiota bacterium]
MTSTDSFFDHLKQHRESQNIEIGEICEFTKINPKYIQAIEEGDFQVLPTVYMRLFLRAYTEYIGADSGKALVDYELYTTGKISSPEIEVKPNTIEPVSKGLSETPEPFLAQISPKQIATGAAVIIGIFLILFWAGKITDEQSDEIDNTPPKTTQSSPLQDESKDIPSADTIPSTEDSAEKKNP